MSSAPTSPLLTIVGCGPLTAAKIVGESRQMIRSKDAFARLNGRNLGNALRRPRLGTNCTTLDMHSTWLRLAE